MGMPRRIVLASANPKKAAELAEILAEAGGGAELLPRPPEVPEVVEDADDFLGNARLKARALLAATGIDSLADDSGLEVDALQGAPGVRSARYAGDDADDQANTERLLTELERRGVAKNSGRTARFRSVVVLVRADGAEFVAEGTVEGRIADEPRGSGGFGYDPVFIPAEGDGRTFAEMDVAEKHAISHRGRALRDLVSQLRS
jgi:XTP/dITP diphosphohydrolase